ncbi:alpha/beta hydrolase [Isoptericola sp. NEAU-Y5]|uniref:Alpha/beta hydrolase n=1 Tax=Isoptericola luteus TaxID=2879484 RepID=A0ABS7ZBT7_9MICO|nr:alpha/beta hydrolase [Isoptericola sp. NEAU-Y5]MCA5892487.1 alpha/beta hydrolase [Isoptericola sp. NEAU-Y5]
MLLQPALLSAPVRRPGPDAHHHPVPLVAAGTPGRTGVVFVHGMRTSSAIWDRQVDHVRATGHDALAVDLPAHGARRGQRFSMPAAFDVIDAATRSFRPGTAVVVVGLSLGGYTSLAWAARHARLTAAGHDGPRLAGVVASGCTADPRGKPVALFRDVARLTVAGAAAVRRGTSAAGTTWRRALTGGSSIAGGAEPAALLYPAASRGTVPAGAAAAPGWDVVTDALSQLAGRSSTAHLREIAAPVWLVNGARDRMRLEEARHLAAARDGALVVVPAAGHDVNSDAPDAFNRVLSRALTHFARA